MYELGQGFARIAAKKGVELQTGINVDADYVEREMPDALIIAVGSEPIIPPLPGIDSDRVVVVNDLHRAGGRIGGKVVVLGGGLSGCECALHLSHQGREVTVVEMRPELAADANIRNRPILLEELRVAKVRCLTQTRGVAVTDSGLKCLSDEDGELLVEADTVVCAVGQRSRSAVVDSLRDSAPYVRIIGDCLRPSTITNAVYQGYYAGLDI
jgi:pyruvate/2-oxoglutarate dehydrogenase complex dihydrolipoamide dehydrogenase (E3) component